MFFPDGLRVSVKFPQPVGSKNKIKLDLDTRVFPRCRQFAHYWNDFSSGSWSIFCLNGRFVFIDFGFTRLSRNAIFEVTQYTVDNEDTSKKVLYTHGKTSNF